METYTIEVNETIVQVVNDAGASVAEKYAQSAKASSDNASQKAVEAAASAASASSMASLANTHAMDAASSVQSAEGFAGDASQSASSASAAAILSEEKSNEAAASADNANYNAGIAYDHKVSAATSAQQATTKAGEASTSATAALGSQNAAATSASQAATSATNASTSATSAANAATTATTKAGEASNSATAAGSSASTASTAATTATTKAGEAATSASTASSAATTATTKASDASSSATTATTKASEAAASAASALLYAQNSGVMPAMRDSLGVFPGIIRPTLNLHAGLVSNDDCPLGTFARSAPKWRLGPTGLLESVAADKVAREWDILGYLLGWSLEDIRTGRLWPSRDLTHSRWVVDGIDPLKNSTGADGVINSASTITATKDNAVIYQDYTASGLARSLGVRIKRKTGSGGVYLSQDGGSTWTDITGQLSTTSWYRASVVQTVTNPRCLIKLSTNGDALYVDFFNIEDGAFLTSDIETVSGAVTRPADVWTIPTSEFAFNASEGTVYIEAEHASNDTSVPGILWGFGNKDGFNSPFYLISQGQHLYASTGSDNAYLSSSMVMGMTFKGALSYAVGSPFTVNLDGGSEVSSSNSLSQFDSVYLTVGSSPWFGDTVTKKHLKHIAYFPRSMTNANRKLITA